MCVYKFVCDPHLIAMQGQRFKADRHEESWHARQPRDSIMQASRGLKSRDRKSTWGWKWRGYRGSPIEFDVSCKRIFGPCFSRGRRALILFGSANCTHGDLQIRDDRSSRLDSRILPTGCIFLMSLRRNIIVIRIHKFSSFRQAMSEGFIATSG